MPRRIPKSWNEVSEELRNLQDLISSHQSRFRDADCNDIAGKLEKAILLLMDAQSAADELSRGRRWTSDWLQGFQHLLDVCHLCEEYKKSLGLRESDVSGIWSAALFLRSVVALDAVTVLVESDLNDDAAIIIRTMFEIESQLGAIKEQPELATRLIQQTERDRLKRIEAMIESKRELPEGVSRARDE